MVFHALRRHVARPRALEADREAIWRRGSGYTPPMQTSLPATVWRCWRTP